MKIKFQKGFSLIETILVLGIATVVAFLSIQKQAHDSEFATADLAGQQLQFLANGFNAYIAANYGEFVTYTGGGTDPVTSCTYSSATNCEVTAGNITAAFVTPGFLPTGSNNLSPYGPAYHFYVRMVGTAPNIFAEGLIMTDGPLTAGSANPRYDLLGELLSNAGITAGEIPSATVSATPNFQTVSGAYTLANGTFPFPSTSRGVWGVYLKFQQYSEFLRRDGTLPMTGNLNMGGPACINVGTALTCSTNVGNLINTNSVESPTGGNLTLDGDQGIIVNANNGSTFQVNANQSNFSGNVAVANNFTVGGNATITGDATAKDLIATTSVKVGNATITNPSGGTVASFNGALEADDLFLRNRGGIALSVALPYYSSRGAFVVTDGTQIQLPDCTKTPSSGVTPSYPSDLSPGSPTGIGSAKIIVTPANILALGVTDSNTYETGVTFIADADTTTKAGYWTIHLQTTDPNGNVPYGNGLQGIAHAYCVYGN